ncbi:hypothetical protein DIPPA_00927 [Diplonema papillatum]|nr:hypothetical protein DIPPA_00927 [Diplonema papillatum]
MESSDLLDLSHDLDEVTAQFKRMVEAVKEERTRLQGRHRQEVRDMQDKYEAEKMELLRQA